MIIKLSRVWGKEMEARLKGLLNAEVLSLHTAIDFNQGFYSQFIQLPQGGNDLKRISVWVNLFFELSALSTVGTNDGFNMWLLTSVGTHLPCSCESMSTVVFFVIG
ncbi:protein Brevis radix-like 4 [Rutidosis leptorrhynchoides]|uniref:protein Brevis radix-like 4 n=1 Tax=Rutidosis leptorrhynchoides TaxID=125765 RepID=UPI003A999F97